MITRGYLKRTRERELPKRGRLCSLVGGALMMGASGNSTGGGASYATTVNAIGPIGYWRLGETSGTVAADQIGANDGAYINGPTLGVAGANPVDNDKAISLDYTASQYVNIAHNAIFDFTTGAADQPFSVGAWVYKNALGTQGSILSNAYTTSNLSWYLHINSANLLRLQLYSQNGSADQIYAEFDVSGDVGGWHFYVATYDGSGTAAGIRLYRDGALLASTNGSAGSYAHMAATTASIQIGGGLLGDGTYFNYWDGRLDEAMIFDKALTAAQVKALYLGLQGYPLAIMADSPAGYWRLGEASGTTAADMLAANNGTYQNGPTLGVTGLLTGDGNTAVSFAGVGTSQYVTTPYNPPTGSAARSFECWVGGFTAAGTGGSDTHALCAYGVAATSTKFVVRVNDSGATGTTGSVRLEIQGDATVGATAINDGSAHHVVVVLDGPTVADVRIYIDGVEDTHSVDGAATVATSAGALAFAADPVSTTLREWLGVLDEVAFYGYALTAAQVLAHYNAGIGV